MPFLTEPGWNASTAFGSDGTVILYLHGSGDLGQATRAVFRKPGFHVVQGTKGATVPSTRIGGLHQGLKISILRREKTFTAQLDSVSAGPSYSHQYNSYRRSSCVCLALRCDMGRDLSGSLTIISSKNLMGKLTAST